MDQWIWLFDWLAKNQERSDRFRPKARIVMLALPVCLLLGIYLLVYQSVIWGQIIVLLTCNVLVAFMFKIKEHRTRLQVGIELIEACAKENIGAANE